MKDEQDRQTLCGECDRELDEASHTPVEARGPCPTCGSTSRKYLVFLSGTVGAVGFAKASLTFVSGEVDVKEEPDTMEGVGHVEAPKGLALEDLPTEVIAECLEVGVKILEPDEHGMWPVEIGANGVVGMLSVTSLDDAVLEVAEWMRGLALRWKERLDEAD